MLITETDEGVILLPNPTARELTGRQRNTIVIARAIANDMDANGTREEQHSAALLRLVVDAVERGYQAELVRYARKWAAAREMGAGR